MNFDLAGLDEMLRAKVLKQHPELAAVVEQEEDHEEAVLESTLEEMRQHARMLYQEALIWAKKVGKHDSVRVRHKRPAGRSQAAR